MADGDDLGRNWTRASLALTAGLVVSAAIASLLLPLTWDVAWRLWVAGRMLDGAALYSDLIEINPPLWFWTALPLAAARRITGLSAEMVVTLWTHAWALGVLGLFAVLARPLLGRAALAAALPAAAFALVWVPMGEAGQREQAFLGACLIWASLAARREAGVATPPPLALLAAAVAGPGFALKHWFVAVPVAVELWLVWRQRAAWRPLRPETLVLAAMALAYALAVPVLAPDFLGRIVPLAALSYGAVAEGSLVRAGEIAGAGAVALLPLLAVAILRPRGPLSGLLVGLSALALVLVVAQMKGFSYHHQAARGLALVAVVLVAVEGWGRGRRALAGGVLAAGLVLGPLVTLQLFAFHRLPESPVPGLGADLRQSPNPVLATLAATAPGTRVAVLSGNPGLAFAAPVRTGHGVPLRHYGLWMSAGLNLAAARSDATGAAARAERARVREEFARDLACAAPDLIVADLTAIRDGRGGQTDALGWLQADPGFARWLDERYRARPADRGIVLLDARTPAPPRRGPGCIDALVDSPAL